MMRSILIPIILMCSLQSEKISGMEILDLLPPLPSGWEIVVDDKVYTPETLYEYINGGAELFLSYGMKEVGSRIIAKGDNEIRIEVFDLIHSRNAFGVFSHTRTQDEKEFGQGSQYFTGTLIFWKANYYIALTANDENEEIIAVIGKMAAEIDDKIDKTGTVPDIIDCLPEEEMLKDGFVYFHHYVWLNSYYYLSNDNLLNINDNTLAVLAKYGSKESRHFLLLIKYPDKELAHKAHKNLLAELYEGKAEIIQLEDNGWTGSERLDNYLLAVFNAPSKSSADHLLSSTITNIKSKP